MLTKSDVAPERAASSEHDLQTLARNILSITTHYRLSTALLLPRMLFVTSTAECMARRKLGSTGHCVCLTLRIWVAVFTLPKDISNQSRYVNLNCRTRNAHRAGCCSGLYTFSAFSLALVVPLSSLFHLTKINAWTWVGSDYLIRQHCWS